MVLAAITEDKSSYMYVGEKIKEKYPTVEKFMEAAKEKAKSKEEKKEKPTRSRSRSNGNER